MCEQEDTHKNILKTEKYLNPEKRKLTYLLRIRVEESSDVTLATLLVLDRIRYFDNRNVWKGRQLAPRSAVTGFLIPRTCCKDIFAGYGASLPRIFRCFSPRMSNISRSAQLRSCLHKTPVVFFVERLFCSRECFRLTRGHISSISQTCVLFPVRTYFNEAVRIESTTKRRERNQIQLETCRSEWRRGNN